MKVRDLGRHAAITHAGEVVVMNSHLFRARGGIMQDAMYIADEDGIVEVPDDIGEMLIRERIAQALPEKASREHDDDDPDDKAEDDNDVPEQAGPGSSMEQVNDTAAKRDPKPRTSKPRGSQKKAH